MILTFIISLLIAGLTGNSSTPCDSVKIKDNLVSWGHKKVDLPRRIEAIIIHSSYNALTSDSFSVDGILEEYKRINVSPHYIIDRSGVIYRLVRDEEIAYHAGKSRLPDGKTDVNRVSIGIELINTETAPPTEAQYVSLMKLITCLKEKYPVKYVLGHSDIAPGRKTDPWDFDWQKLDAMLKSP
jgi:N-acetylmuramoyl-L-alanine amidase